MDKTINVASTVGRHTSNTVRFIVRGILIIIII